jgi:general secretion pathway protein D
MTDNARISRYPVRILLIGWAVLMASCATAPEQPAPAAGQPALSTVRQGPAAPSTALSPAADETPQAEDASGNGRPLDASVRLGTGVFVAEGARKAEDATAPADADVTLNFEAASLREFVKVIFEDILGENYLIDPKVDGVVTLHTSRPVPPDAVLPILESVLQLNGAALLQDQGVYRVIPFENAEGAAASPRVGRRPARGGAGFGVQIVPLQNVAAGEIEKLLKPFLPQGSAMRVDAARNLLILSGPRYRLSDVLATIDVFDVDWLKGMSFGLFPLHYADAGTLVQELQKVIGEGETPLAGIVRLVPIERLNAILVITHQPHHMAKLRALIEEFDWGAEVSTPGRRLYVYNLKNGKAENIAAVLQELFGQALDVQQPLSSGGQERLPPGQGTNAFVPAREVSQLPPPVGAPGAGGDYPPATAQAPVQDRTAMGATPGDGAAGSESEGPVTIMADQDNNAILVMASPRDYRAIESAIRKLDVAPRQVLIDATIAEVTLNDSLDYGVRWFMDSSILGTNFELALGDLSGAAGGDGLTLALFNHSGDVRAFFDLLESVSSVKFLSAPQVMVLDNQSAQINVGDQIPVTVRSSQSTTNPDSPIVTEVQFRDTGTLLSVTPRINAGGQVTLEISQEVSLPGTEPAVGGGGNVSIAQRTINSTVVVQSGQTVVLGGLIRESKNEAKSGIPLLMDLPWLGNLFSTTSEDVSRTELIITISPRVIEDARAALDATQELRSRMKDAAEFSSSVLEKSSSALEKPAM